MGTVCHIVTDLSDMDWQQSVGTTWLWSCSHLLRSVCVTSPLSAQHNTTVVQLHSHTAPSVSLPNCQHSTTPLLFSCTVTLPPLCHFPTVSTAQHTVVQLRSQFAPSVSLPHCQHSTTTLLFSCTITLPPLYHFTTVSTVQRHCCSAAQSLSPLCVTSPLSAQCNATVVQLHSNFAPPVYKTVYSKFSVLLRPNSETAARGGGENWDYTNGVLIEAFSVENCNGNNM